MMRLFSGIWSSRGLSATSTAMRSGRGDRRASSSARRRKRHQFDISLAPVEGRFDIATIPIAVIVAERATGLGFGARTEIRHAMKLLDEAGSGAAGATQPVQG